MLDERDRKLLSLLQADADRPVNEIADLVALSASACSRRIARLREDGYIARSTVELDRRRIGLKAGMTEEQMTACWEDTAKVEQLIATFQTNATADEVEATPTFIIGGEKVSNQPWDSMKEITDTKLAEAAPAQ